METRPPEPLPEVSWAEFLGAFGPSVHAAIAAKFDDPSVEGVFMAEKAELNPNRYGLVAVVYGPGKTLAAGDLAAGKLIGDMPSQLKVMKNHVTRAGYLAAVAAGWKPPVKAWTDLPGPRQFRGLLDGDRFDFVGPDPRTNSFTKTCFKTGARTYRDEDGVEHEVGSTSCRVYHVAREEWK